MRKKPKKPTELLPWRPSKRDVLAGYLVDAVLLLATKQTREAMRRGMIEAAKDEWLRTHPKVPVGKHIIVRRQQ